MKKILVLIVAALFIFSAAGMSFAAEQKAAAPAAEKKEAAPAKAEEKKAPEKVKQVTGDVAAVDAKANTLTVKGKKGDVMLSADDKTTVKIGKDKKTLADVKVGDKAVVKYVEADGKNTAKSITVEAAKAEMKKEEAKPAEPAKPAKPAKKK